MAYIEIRWGGAEWYCNVHGDDCQYKYRQRVPAEFGPDDAEAVIKWVGVQWPEAALEIDDSIAASSHEHR